MALKNQLQNASEQRRLIQFEFDQLIFSNPEETKDFEFNQNYFDSQFGNEAA